MYIYHVYIDSSVKENTSLIFFLNKRHVVYIVTIIHILIIL